MDRMEYLEQLEKELSCLPKEERDSAVSFYEEIFIEAGEENEGSVAARLGGVKKLSAAILAENGEYNNNYFEQIASSDESQHQNSFKQANNKEKLNSSSALFVLIAITTFPFWISIFAFIFALLIAGAATIFGLTVAIIVLGTVGIGYGLSNLPSDPSISFLIMGTCCLIVGILILIIVPFAKVFSSFCKWIIKGIGNLFKNIFAQGGILNEKQG